MLWIDGLDVRGVERVWNGRPDGKAPRKSSPRDYGGQCADCGGGVTRTRARECRGLGITVRCPECELEFFP
ncbi:MAG: hypothetical protein OXB97_07810 [Rhodospirillales bacterium]|nr:hypothetical protein [Rhodospirillales bacterium]